ncbi:MAG: FadR/GntR family transcriptional regulator, partial [Phocaeicola sp.]
LREVYRQLEIMGYIKLEAGRGAFVAETQNSVVEEVTNYFRLNSGKMKDYLEVRLSFDAHAARLAAERRTEDEVILLEAYQREFEDAVSRKDNVLMATLDAKFHEKIVDMAHNELMLALEKLINFYFSQLRQKSFLLDEHANNAIEPHRAILSAIRKGDGELAALESTKHMQRSLSDICGC